jgi:hypothetical protein
MIRDRLLVGSFFASLCINTFTVCVIGQSKILNHGSHAAAPKPDAIAKLQPVRISMYKPPAPPKVLLVREDEKPGADKAQPDAPKGNDKERSPGQGSGTSRPAGAAARPGANGNMGNATSALAGGQSSAAAGGGQGEGSGTGASSDGGANGGASGRDGDGGDGNEYGAEESGGERGGGAAGQSAGAGFGAETSGERRRRGGAGSGTGSGQGSGSGSAKSGAKGAPRRGGNSGAAGSVVANARRWRQKRHHRFKFKSTGAHQQQVDYRSLG